MKRLSFILVFLLAWAVSAQAQDSYGANPDYRPRDSWPYIYERFMPGAVRTAAGDLMEYQSFNICVGNGRMHYIYDGKIMEADMTKVFTALINLDTYVNVGGKMYRVFVQTNDGAIVFLTSIDTDELNKVDIGYGVSSSTASQTNTSLDLLLGGNTISSVLVSQTLTIAEQQKNTGKELPLKEDCFFLVKGRLVPATKRDIQDAVGKEAAKPFFKENKLKWNKPESLIPVLAFLNANMDD